MAKLHLTIILITAALVIGCSSKNRKTVNSTKNPLASEIIADTIIYDVIVRNIDKSDVWEAECLQYVNQKSLIDYLFNGVYNGQFSAIEFLGDKVLSIDDVKAIEQESGFSRDRVSKVQFRERWFIDSAGNFQKQIISYTLGIEAYSKQNSFLGHKALFIVKPKP